LVIFDRHKRCQLTDGMYEIVLHHQDSERKKEATWESVMDGKVRIRLEYFVVLRQIFPLMV